MGALFLTNIICLIPVAATIMATSEARSVAAFPHARDPGFQFALLWSATLAGLMNYLVFLSAAVNSPLTTSITGQVTVCLCAVCERVFFWGWGALASATHGNQSTSSTATHAPKSAASRAATPYIGCI